jgi:hypothetical protein
MLLDGQHPAAVRKTPVDEVARIAPGPIAVDLLRRLESDRR